MIPEPMLAVMTLVPLRAAVAIGLLIQVCVSGPHARYRTALDGSSRHSVQVSALPHVAAARESQASAPGPDIAQLSERAKASLEARNWSQAAAALEKLAELLPNSPEVHANLGLSYYFQGRPAQAVTAFKRAVALKPQLPEARVMIAICEAELGRDAEAVAVLAPAFHKPSDPEMGRLIGLHLQRSYAELRQFDKSVATGEELLKRYPGDAEILFQVSRSYADRSYELINDLMHSAPDSAWMHYANAQVQESLARYDVAKREYENVLKKDSSLAGVHYRLGRVILLGAARTPQSLEEATREFREELAIDPRNAPAQYELAEINREQGNYDVALDYFSRAVAHQPNFIEALIGLGRTLITVGRSVDAVPHLKEAARLDPENKVPHALLANAYRTMGDRAAAQTEMDLYSKLSQAGTASVVPAAGAPTAQQVDP